MPYIECKPVEYQVVRQIELTDSCIEKLANALKQKTGKWINCKYPLGECSECHAIVDIANNEANYCPVCGSKNRGEEE